ncbi:hypothetical protein AAG570_004711 [Ranatra chinensis]|uniref:Uncharacterized protein n=1 Tax=Ranatra chinensis TaxID=642074 RepID=A0ABD0Y3Y0_9HEMI
MQALEVDLYLSAAWEAITFRPDGTDTFRIDATGVSITLVRYHEGVIPEVRTRYPSLVLLEGSGSVGSDHQDSARHTNEEDTGRICHFDNSRRAGSATLGLGGMMRERRPVAPPSTPEFSTVNHHSTRAPRGTDLEHKRIILTGGVPLSF